MASKTFNFKKGADTTIEHNSKEARLQSAVLNLFGGAAAQYQQLPLDLLDTYPSQSTYSMDADKIESLADSIRLKGVLQPIVVRTAHGGRYEILAGHRRTAASTLAGLTTIPALIYINLDDVSASYIFHATNLESRNDLSPSMRAQGYAEIAQLLETQGFPEGQTTAAVAKDTGVTVRTVQRYNRLALLNKELLDKVDDGVISVRAAGELSYLPEREQQKVAKKLKPNEGITQEVARTMRRKAEGVATDIRPQKLDFAPFARFFEPTAAKQEIVQQMIAALEYYQKEHST